MNSVTTWLELIARGLDSGDLNIQFLNLESFKPNVDIDDSRQVLLAEQALEQLPMPMRTLLKALKDLKRDIVVSECDSIDRRDTILTASLSSAVWFTSKSLSNLCAEIKNVLKIEVISDDLRKAVNDVGVKSESQDWLKDLEELLKKERLAMYEDLRDMSAQRIMERPTRRINVDNVVNAIENSKAIRDRLSDLNTGQLKSLRSNNSVVSSISDLVEEEPVRIASVDKLERPERPSIADITTLIRRVRREFDKVKSRQSIALDDAISACSAAVLAETRLLKSRQHIVDFKVPDELVKADTALQNEIKLLLQTLTVDRSALDQYLRSIRASCESVKFCKERESTTSLRIALEQWQTLLKSSWSSFCEVQRQYT